MALEGEGGLGWIEAVDLFFFFFLLRKVGGVVREGSGSVRFGSIRLMMGHGHGHGRERGTWNVERGYRGVRLVDEIL